MTDEQIVRALECCGEMKDCKKECPLGDVGGIDKCMHTLMLDALELIKRQQAAIECFADIGKMYSEVRAEAVREFAERLKKELNITGNGGWFEIGESGLIGAIDDLVKEMTEGRK